MTLDNPYEPGEVIGYLSETASSGAEYYDHDSINGCQDYSEHTTFSPDGKAVTLELK